MSDTLVVHLASFEDHVLFVPFFEDLLSLGRERLAVLREDLTFYDDLVVRLFLSVQDVTIFQVQLLDGHSMLAYLELLLVGQGKLDVFGAESE